MGCIEETSQQAFEPSGQWVVNALQAGQLSDEGALVLDARGRSAWNLEHISGSFPVAWETFSDSVDPYRGRLHADDELLTAQLRRLGVEEETPVIVVGEPVGGWGEDGRIAWMLRTLGHPRAVIVDGGYHALAEAGFPTNTDDPPPPRESDFAVQREPSLAIDIDDVARLIRDHSDDEVLFVDTRERREYDGETPYGESRGGHLPGALHLHFEELLDEGGALLDREAILGRLAEQGLTPDRTIVAYCTGGIRSGWLVMLLRELEFERSRNYAGSMWEWSAGDPEAFPLE